MANVRPMSLFVLWIYCCLFYSFDAQTSIGNINFQTLTPQKEETTSAVFTCNADNICQDTEYKCQSKEDCSIYCNKADVCNGAIFNCPSGFACNVYCEAARTCAGITIHAEESSSLDITIGQFSEVMANSNIYVPNTGVHELNTIDCGSSKIYQPCQSMNIYSTYGISDLNLQCSTADCFTDSLVYCNNEDRDADAYEASCSLSCLADITSGRSCWTCTESSHRCASLKTPAPTKTPTDGPSLSPSLLPSVSPTTETPTTSMPTTGTPSKSPTTAQPTTATPTTQPTSNPTTTPINDGEVGNGDESSESGSNAKNNAASDANTLSTVDSSVLYAGLVIVIIILCCSIIGFLFYRERAKVKKKQMEMEIAQIRMTKSDNNTPNGLPTNQMIRIQSISTGGNISEARVSSISHLSDEDVLNGMTTGNGFDSPRISSRISSSPIISSLTGPRISSLPINQMSRIQSSSTAGGGYGTEPNSPVPLVGVLHDETTSIDHEGGEQIDDEFEDMYGRGKQQKDGQQPETNLNGQRDGDPAVTAGGHTDMGGPDENLQRNMQQDDDAASDVETPL